MLQAYRLLHVEEVVVAHLKLLFEICLCTGMITMKTIGNVHLHESIEKNQNKFQDKRCIAKV